jgi:hypothetical protein
MFGFGRPDQPTAEIRWSQLLPLLEDDDRRAAIQREFPQREHESFLWGLRRVDPEVAEQCIAAGRQLETATPLANFPTLAVAGMLNSGKTSLVTTFLGPAGRRRTLRGDNNSQGTHRFVLWLPASWQSDPEVWGLLLRRIGEALGHAPEMLHDEPERAFAQYNNQGGGVDALSVPLVATDPGLDEHGVGFLDCPDIVSDAAFGRGAPETRRDLLRKAASLCSGFIVVTGAEAIRDKTLGDLLRSASELMPGIPRMLAVNKVRPAQTPDAVWANTRELASLHGIDEIYVAYDFEIPSAQPFIPRQSAQLPGAGDDSLPCFYRVAAETEHNPPAEISSDRFLTELPKHLETAELFVQVRTALEGRLRDLVWNVGVRRLEEAAREARREAVEIRGLMLDACLDFFARRHPGGQIAELRLHQSERIIRQLTGAFAEAAPWYARIGMRMNSRFRKIWGGASDFVARFAPSKIAESAAESAKEKIRLGKQGSLLNAERLKDALLLRIDLTRLPAIPDADRLVSRGQQAIERFDDEDFTSLDSSRLQTAVEEVWRRMPVTKKMKAGLTPLAIVFAAFGAALMVPIDFGGSGVLLAASIKELLLAAGVSLAGVAWGGGLVLVDIEQQAARQQLSNFLAVLCDSLGIPRADKETNPVTLTVGDQQVQLPAPTVTRRTAAEVGMVQWHVRESFLNELQQYLKQP